MTTAENPGQGGTPGTGDDTLQVVIDLLEEDALLREALAEPTGVRLPTGKVISIPHLQDWPHQASRLVALNAWDAWASEVLSEDDAKAFTAAKLRNYQLQRVAEVVTAAGATPPGKPQRSSGPSRSTRRR